MEVTLAEKDDYLLERGTWVLANLCECSPGPAYEKVTDAIPFLCTTIKEEINLDVCKNILKALEYFAHKKPEIARILEYNIIPSLVRFLEYDKREVSE